MLEIKNIPNLERAQQLRRGIYNAAKHAGVSAEAGTVKLSEGDAMGIHKTGDTYTLKFRVHDKRIGRKYLVETKGTDRSNWSYNPRAKGF